MAELRWLVDAGNEEAANRLAELAAGRGDLAELRWLVDAGNDEAANRLSDFISEHHVEPGAVVVVSVDLDHWG